jgi:hypothetical protein
LTNAIVTIWAARTLSLNDFSLFALCVLIAQFGLGLLRTYVGEPVLVASRNGPSTVSSTPHEAFLLGLLGAGLLGAVSLAVSSATRTSLIALAVGLPCLMVQDANRYVAIAVGHSRRAVYSDGIWFAAILLAITANASAGIVSTPDSFLVVWLLGAALPLGLMFRSQLRFLPPSLARGWNGFRQQANHRLNLAGAFVLTTGTSQLVLLLAPALYSIAIGPLRGGLILFSPISLLITSLQVVTLGAVGQFRSNGRFIAGIASAAGAVLLWVALLARYDEIGEWLLGATWPATQPLVAAAATIPLAQLLFLGPQVACKVYGAGDLLRSCRVVATVVAAGALTPLARRYGGSGVLLSLSVGMLCGALTCAWFLLTRTRSPKKAADGA